MHYKNLKEINNDYKKLETIKLPNILPLPGGLKFFIENDKQRHLWLWSDEPNTGKTTFL